MKWMVLTCVVSMSISMPENVLFLSIMFLHVHKICLTYYLLLIVIVEVRGTLMTHT